MQVPLIALTVLVISSICFFPVPASLVTNGCLGADPPSNAKLLQQDLPLGPASLLQLHHGKCRQSGGEARRVPDQEQSCHATGEAPAEQRAPEEGLHPERPAQLPQHQQVGALQ